MDKSKNLHLWLPKGADPLEVSKLSENFEVLDAAVKEANSGAFKVGDTLQTLRNDLGDSWALCNGAAINFDDFPQYKAIAQSQYDSPLMHPIILSGKVTDAFFQDGSLVFHNWSSSTSGVKFSIYNIAADVNYTVSIPMSGASSIPSSPGLFLHFGKGTPLGNVYYMFWARSTGTANYVSYLNALVCVGDPRNPNSWSYCSQSTGISVGVEPPRYNESQIVPCNDGTINVFMLSNSGSFTQKIKLFPDSHAILLEDFVPNPTVGTVGSAGNYRVDKASYAAQRGRYLYGTNRANSNSGVFYLQCLNTSNLGAGWKVAVEDAERVNKLFSLGENMVLAIAEGGTKAWVIKNGTVTQTLSAVSVVPYWITKFGEFYISKVSGTRNYHTCVSKNVPDLLNSAKYTYPDSSVKVDVASVSSGDFPTVGIASIGTGYSQVALVDTVPLVESNGVLRTFIKIKEG